MKLIWIALITGLAISSPQFWWRIGAPSAMQPAFMLAFVGMAFVGGGIRLPRNVSSQFILIGLSVLLFAGILSLPFVQEFELFEQELMRRIVLLFFLLAAYSIAIRGNVFFRAVSGLTIVAVISYLVTMVLYYLDWGGVRESGDFDAYPFGFILPVAVYNNSLIFSETQVFGYFLLGVALLHAARTSKMAWLYTLVGLLQFGKGPIIGYLISRLPNLGRAAIFLLTLPAIFVMAISFSDPPSFDGNLGSFSERIFHAHFVLYSLLDHPLMGFLGYGFRQYGSYLLPLSSDFTQDTVPLSVMQWVFEAGIPLAALGIVLVIVGAMLLPERRWLPVGVYLTIGHLALPNPGDPSVLLLFAMLAAEINRNSPPRNEQARIP